MKPVETLESQFAAARRELLELSTSNRLLNTKRDTVRGAAIEVKAESTSSIFRMLVLENHTLKFEEGELVEVEEAVPVGETESDNDVPAAKSRRTKKRVTTKNMLVDVNDEILHTALDPNDLDRRLNRLYTDSHAIMQEQGVNVLFLALGFLRWFEPNFPDLARHAPLLLVPVKLVRAKAGSRYSLNFDATQEIITNFTLKTRLKIDFGIHLPEISDEIEEIQPLVYFKSVAEAVRSQPDWKVLEDDIVLWFFSFSKLLMYRDLDPVNWSTTKPLPERPLIRSLLLDGFRPAEPLVNETASIDDLLDPEDCLHVVDCDSSQALVVEEVLRGRSLVIQGPPGTGKSQTITNIIAAAIADRRTVLFVAEKMAALEVVKRRLDNIGLGDMVLELHSHKTNKRAVLQELDRTLKQGSPQIPSNQNEIVERLRQRRDLVNQYVATMHSPFSLRQVNESESESDSQPPLTSDITPYQMLSELIALRAQNTPLPDFQITEAVDWSQEEFRRKQESIAKFAAMRNEIGDPLLHPWRGTQPAAISPLDLERMVSSIPQRIVELDEILQSARILAERLSAEWPLTLQQVQELLHTFEAFSIAPPVDSLAYAHSVWQDDRGTIQELADQARKVLLAKEKLTGVVNETAWDRELAEEMAAYQHYGQKWFRMFSSRYRQARRTLQQMLSGTQPDTFEARVAIFKLLHDRGIGLKSLNEASELGEKAFGRFWLGSATDLKELEEWEKWDRISFERAVLRQFRTLLPKYEPSRESSALAGNLKTKTDRFELNFLSLCSSLKIDLAVAFEKWSPSSTADNQAKPKLEAWGNAIFAPAAEIKSRLLAWREHPELRNQWQTFRHLQTEVEAIGEGVVARQITEGNLLPEDAPAVFRFARAEALLRAFYQQHPELETFDSVAFERLVDEFCQSDIERIELARTEIARAHWDQIGQTENALLPQAVATLRHEMQKQKRHIPLRKLLRDAGCAIQSVKPVFMMSPISVAQYLEPGGMEFDILLIDEASQVRPVEALGAAARCQQMVVVGDDKQMPPTQFFSRVIGEMTDEDEEASDMQAGDVESILGLAIAHNMPQRMLRWHYRSKHESLIAVSNREFYDNQLYVVPSPERRGELGVQLTYIEHGKFLRGKNEIEAQIVAEAIMSHAREKPKWTLGVAAFSVTQRDSIIHALEKIRRADPSCETFFDPSAPDPFFIKNLENVQGDERDVIFVSVGYGPGEDGRVALNFGPISNAGGERRLNVLMTRAKSVLRIFTSMRAEAIDLNRATGRGPAVFREYLRFAQEFTSPRSQTDLPASAQAETAQAKSAPNLPALTSPDRLTEVLKRELEQRGYQLLTQVGIAGLFVDLAVLDPENLERCIVGIALDGPNYQSARSARDRNRNFDGVLAAQGWVMHRMWSPDWFSKPQLQLNRLVEVIEAAKKGQAPKKSSRLASPVSKIERRPMTTNPLELAVNEPEKLPPKSSRKTRTTKSATPSMRPVEPRTTQIPRGSESANSKSNFWLTFWKGSVATFKLLGSVLRQVITILNKVSQTTGKPSTRKTPPRKKK
jgi:very-short-patch-repair endonuclease